MPKFIKSETVQRLTVSQRALSDAFAKLAIPRPIGYERLPSDGAIEIGLIGVSAELAIVACLYEILGESGITRENNGFYLTASEALSRFRDTLKSKSPRLAVLTHKVGDTSTHLQKLEDACSGFQVLFTARASAIHGGVGVSHDVAFTAGKTVSDFLLSLAKSTKLKPYLRHIPSIPALPKEKTLIAQELGNLLQTKDKSKIASSIIGIYLVLPELVSSEPEWLTALGRVQVTPREQDISVLIKSLQKAKVGELVKVGNANNAIAAKIVDAKSNPDALPIQVQQMKSTFSKDSDIWSSYVGNANGELEKGILALPPIDSIYRFAAFGISNIGIPEEVMESGLSAHSVWPFVASALAYKGTKGPCFYLIRVLKEGEIGQLIKQLKRAASLSNTLKKALDEYEPVFQAVGNNKKNPGTKLIRELSDSINRRLLRKERLIDKLSERTKNTSNDRKPAYEMLVSMVSKNSSLAGPLNDILDDTIKLNGEKLPVLRLLINAAINQEDLIELKKILDDKSLLPSHTEVRKAIQEIDYYHFSGLIKAPSNNPQNRNAIAL